MELLRFDDEKRVQEVEIEEPTVLHTYSFL